MLQLTESAKEAVRGIVAAEEAPERSGLRIASDDGSDGGPSLSMAVAESPSAGDAVIDEDGAIVFLDEKAAAFLDDKVLDATAHGDHFHFVVDDQDGAES